MLICVDSVGVVFYVRMVSTIALYCVYISISICLKVVPCIESGTLFFVVIVSDLCE